LRGAYPVFSILPQRIRQYRGSNAATQTPHIAEEHRRHLDPTCRQPRIIASRNT
jgi:hypothetical protein